MTVRLPIVSFHCNCAVNLRVCVLAVGSLVVVHRQHIGVCLRLGKGKLAIHWQNESGTVCPMLEAAMFWKVEVMFA